ncbi:MAG: 6-phosphogluconolactonase [Thiothrix sp.]
MPLCRYPNRAQQAEALATRVAARLNEVVAVQGVARLALSGGSSPRQFLQVLDTLPVAWRQVRITLVDERQVPHEHPRSNWRFLHACLPTASQQAAWLPLYATSLSNTCAALQRDYLPLDVVVLGMGVDGHFASLFADAAELGPALVADAPPLMAIHAPSVPEARLSLTLPVLAGAQQLHLLIQGQDKWQTLQAAQRSAATLPIAHLLAAVGDALLIHYAD